MGPTQLLLFLHQYSPGTFYFFFYSFALVPPSGTIENLISLNFLLHPQSLRRIPEIFQDILRINLQPVAAVKIHSG